MTSEQVGKLLGHSPRQIRIWAKQGTLPALRGVNGRQYVFDRDEIIDWIRHHRVTDLTVTEGDISGV